MSSIPNKFSPPPFRGPRPTGLYDVPTGTSFGILETPSPRKIAAQEGTDSDDDLHAFYNANDEAAPSAPEKMKAKVDRNQLFDLHRHLCGESRDTMEKKNQDYANETDVFRNFRMFGGLGILVRISDKLARLRTFEERGTFSVTDESLRDTIEDAINYLVIYYAYKQEEK